MTALVQRIESIINSKGITFKHVEEKCGLGNGTIRRWTKQNPRLDKLILVAQYLNVSLDYLVFGNSQSNISSDLNVLQTFKEIENLTLSNLESDLVAMFRLLPASHQEELFDLAYFKYKHFIADDNNSIYSKYMSQEKSGHW